MNGVCATGTWDKALIGYNWEKASQFVVHGPHLKSWVQMSSSHLHNYVNCVLIYVYTQNLTQSDVLFQFHDVLKYW